MFTKDRFTRGLLAGLFAGVITKVYDLLAYYLHFSTLRWLDFSGILFYGHKPVGLGEQSFATMGTLFFHAALGVIFVFLIQKLITSDNLLLKGWVFGVATWFIIYAITQLSKIPELAFIPLRTSLSNFLGASIWGILLAKSVTWLDNQVKL